MLQHLIFTPFPKVEHAPIFNIAPGITSIVLFTENTAEPSNIIVPAILTKVPEDSLPKRSVFKPITIVLYFAFEFKIILPDKL